MDLMLKALASITFTFKIHDFNYRITLVLIKKEYNYTENGI